MQQNNDIFDMTDEEYQAYLLTQENRSTWSAEDGAYGE